MKRCSTLVLIREMQMKTPVTIAAIKKTRDKCWQGCGDIGALGALLVGM